ncbi:MAG: bifunctional proline dehydrogenase/L-glutamate gamma-semialdehyde dehydrogenase, partial [Alphaproteobacteria bacterium]|nr:bifunctional proline dehydrogenase/L-glutamate gamma-semialdehyde dehydrogenase [Alphaproteobacteria bacterium]
MTADVLRNAISAAYLADEDRVLAERLEQAWLSPAEHEGADALARELVSRIRARQAKAGGIDAFLHEYALSTEEGVVLMCLAESLLRVPDAETADRLIRDKIGGKKWAGHQG